MMMFMFNHASTWHEGHLHKKLYIKLVPVGTNCALLVAVLFLFCYESDFMKSLS